MDRSRVPSWRSAARLNRLQFLTIRRYLTLVFAALILLLSGGGGMALILDLAAQAVQMLLVLAIAPLRARHYAQGEGARCLRRIGPPVVQPYRDLWKLMHKEAVLAHNASWLYRVAPYFVFAATWVGGALDADLRDRT